MQNKENRLSALETMAKLTGIDIQIREFSDEWMLITFDIPVTEEGNKARANFYKIAQKAGYVQHTESVYLAPHSPEAELAALEIAEAGRIFVWTSRVGDELRAREVTKNYDTKATELFDEADKRLARIQSHIEDKKFGIARRMLTKTSDLIDSLVKITAQRGSIAFVERIVAIKMKFNELNGQVPKQKPKKSERLVLRLPRRV